MNVSALPKGRAGGRLRRARENGYLDAACDRDLPGLHSRWCWRLSIPVIWMERCSPHSKFGRLHLDLFTTPRALSAAGREALNKLTAAAAARISAHDACWDRVPAGQLEPLARAVLHTVNRRGNSQLDIPLPSRAHGGGLLLPFPERATA